MPAGYVLLACIFVVLAIVIHLLRRYNTAWIGRDLQRPDLRVLGDVAEGKRFGVARDRLDRLSRRGFAANDKWGGCRITLKGRYAAFIVRTRSIGIHDAGLSDGSPS
jgi:hypothetical protein